jgi:catechol 2,3-dioxygenase-like lactoylglutathione lyase family enzyme
MFGEAHHVALHGLDVRATGDFLTGVLGATVVAPVTAGPTGRLDASFALGSCLLELIEPVDRSTWQYDVIERSGEQSVVSHLAWRYENLADAASNLRQAGLRLREDSPKPSPHGEYLVLNAVPDELTRGIWFQLAEDAVVPPAGPVVSHLHHVVHHVWGLDYLIDLLHKGFDAEPLRRGTVPGGRFAAFRFGRTTAYVVEPTEFGGCLAQRVALGVHGGLAAGEPAVGWAVADLDRRVDELRAGGIGFVQDKPELSAFADHWFIDIRPELAGGVPFRLCGEV